MKFEIDKNKIYETYNEIIINFIGDLDFSFDKDNRLQYLIINYRIFMKYGNEYISNPTKISELYYNILNKVQEFSSILLESSTDIKFLLMRLKRVKKQVITLCLELLSLSSDENVRNLMRKISNKKHCWRIVCDKKLEYSGDFIEEIFD